MYKSYDFECTSCEIVHKDLLQYKEEVPECEKCQSSEHMKRLPVGGPSVYSISGPNGASTKPNKRFYVKT